MYVRFGDGETGARVPTGAEIVARYREGLGLAGLVRAGSLTNAVDRPVGLKAVTNQLPASGAGEPETLDDARTSAPITVRTLGRVVSLCDFADAALESALVAKSRAVHVWNSGRLAHVVRLVVAGERGTELEPRSLTDLLADLDARRDPNRLLEIVPHRNADVTVSVTVVARDSKLLPEDVDASCASGWRRSSRSRIAPSASPFTRATSWRRCSPPPASSARRWLRSTERTPRRRRTSSSTSRSTTTSSRGSTSRRWR